MDYSDYHYHDSEGYSYEIHTTDAEGYATQPYIWQGEDKIYLSNNDSSSLYKIGDL